MIVEMRICEDQNELSEGANKKKQPYEDQEKLTIGGE